MQKIQDFEFFFHLGNNVDVMWVSVFILDAGL